jgi:hypothetical protein
MSPVVVIVEILGVVKTGDVRVLLVKVCVPVNVATVESIDNVTAPEVPPPLKPVPAVTPEISPSVTVYEREFHAVDPSPTFVFLVSVSNPISPAERTAFADAHAAAVPLFN